MRNKKIVMIDEISTTSHACIAITVENLFLQLMIKMQLSDFLEKQHNQVQETESN